MARDELAGLRKCHLCPTIIRVVESFNNNSKCRRRTSPDAVLYNGRKWICQDCWKECLSETSIAITQ